MKGRSNAYTMAWILIITGTNLIPYCLHLHSSGGFSNIDPSLGFAATLARGLELWGRAVGERAAMLPRRLAMAEALVAWIGDCGQFPAAAVLGRTKGHRCCITTAALPFLNRHRRLQGTIRLRRSLRCPAELANGQAVVSATINALRGGRAASSWVGQWAFGRGQFAQHVCHRMIPVILYRFFPLIPPLDRADARRHVALMGAGSLAPEKSQFVRFSKVFENKLVSGDFHHHSADASITRDGGKLVLSCVRRSWRCAQGCVAAAAHRRLRGQCADSRSGPIMFGMGIFLGR